MKILILLPILTILLFFVPSVSYEHQDACHRWHSCPSDSGSYVCGDAGNCSECPNNQYCQDRAPISQSTIAEPIPESISIFQEPSESVTIETSNDTGDFILFLGIE